MGIENLRWWHWILLSLVVGALLAGSKQFYAGSFGSDLRADRTLIDYFDRDLPNSPPDPNDKAYASGAHPPSYITDVVVHPPALKELNDHMAWVIDMQAGPRTVEVEVQNHQVREMHDLEPNNLTPTLVKPVYWEDKKLEAVPPEVMEIAAKALPGATAKAAHYGPSVVHCVVTGVYHEAHEEPINPSDPKSATAWQYRAQTFLHDARVPYELQDQFDEVHHNTHAITIAKNFDPSKARRWYWTVEDYMKALQAKYPSAPIQFRDAKWEEPGGVWATYMGGSVLVIGLIFPGLIYVLTAAGYGRKRQKDDYDLSRFGKGPKDAPAVAKGQPMDLAGVAALNSELEEKLAADGNGHASAPAVVARPATPVVAKLNGKAAKAAAKAEQKAKSKAFGASGGDYYPTEIHAPGKKS